VCNNHHKYRESGGLYKRREWAERKGKEGKRRKVLFEAKSKNAS